MISVVFRPLVKSRFISLRSFSNAFLGNEFQKKLKQLYLHVHPDVMSGFPESVKEANKNSLQVRTGSILQRRY